MASQAAIQSTEDEKLTDGMIHCIDSLGLFDDMDIGELPSEEDLMLCFEKGDDLFGPQGTDLGRLDNVAIQPTPGFSVPYPFGVQISVSEDGGGMPTFTPGYQSSGANCSSGHKHIDRAKNNYRGVSRHRLTQRWEASLWLNGRQLYLGGFDAQQDAAKAYDLAALACKGSKAVTNYPADDYAIQLSEMEGYTEHDVVAYIRRRSTAFSRGRSKYRGVSGQTGRWEARIGSFGGRKNVRHGMVHIQTPFQRRSSCTLHSAFQVSFGVFETEIEAARQYDRALIVEKGRSGGYTQFLNRRRPWPNPGQVRLRAHPGLIVHGTDNPPCTGLCCSENKLSREVLRGRGIRI